MKFWILNGTEYEQPSIAMYGYDDVWLFARQHTAFELAKVHYRGRCSVSEIQCIEVSTDELLSLVLQHGRKSALQKLRDAIERNDDSDIIINRGISIRVHT